MAVHDERKRTGLVVSTFLFTFLFIGSLFGYGPLQLLLEENGSFSSKCSIEEQDLGIVCPAQTAALVSVSFYSQVTQLASPILGQLADHYGPRIMALFSVSCSLISLVLLIVATNLNIDWLLYVAFVSAGFATWSGSLLQMPAALYFNRLRTRSRIIVGLNSVFDAGSITYWGLWGLRQAFGWSITLILSIYVALFVVVGGAVVFFWTVAAPEQAGKPTNELTGEDETDETSSSDDQSSVEDLQQEMIEEASLEGTVNVDVVRKEGAIRYALICERTTKEQLTSGAFLALLAFFAVHVTSNQFVLTTTRDFLAFLGDDEFGNKYLTIFTLLLPASLIAIPVVNIMIGHWGFPGGMHVVNLLGLCFWLVRLLADNLDVQILAFVFFSFFRCFLFGVYFSFLASLLSPTIVGKAAGISLFTTGVTSFLNVPLSAYAVQVKDGDFFVPNLLYTCLILPCVFVAFYLKRVVRKEQAQKDYLSSLHPSSS